MEESGATVRDGDGAPVRDGEVDSGDEHGRHAPLQAVPGADEVEQDCKPAWVGERA